MRVACSSCAASALWSPRPGWPVLATPDSFPTVARWLPRLALRHGNASRVAGIACWALASAAMPTFDHYWSMVPAPCCELRAPDDPLSRWVTDWRRDRIPTWPVWRRQTGRGAWPRPCSATVETTSRRWRPPKRTAEEIPSQLPSSLSDAEPVEPASESPERSVRTRAHPSD